MLTRATVGRPQRHHATCIKADAVEQVSYDTRAGLSRQKVGWWLPGVGRMENGMKMVSN